MFVYRHRRWACAPVYSSSYSCENRRSGERLRASTLMHGWHSGRMFGVRRPLRYLTWKLDLDDQQVRELADILNRLKTSRAQGRVDWERSIADIAASFKAPTFDADKAQAAVERRKSSAEAHLSEVLDALRQLHEILDGEQRAELAYLLQSGAIEI